MMLTMSIGTVFAANNSDKPSGWAENIVKDAIATGLVPENLQKNYTKPISRIDATQLFIQLIEKSSEQAIQDFAYSKWETQSVHGQFNQVPFIDTTDSTAVWGYNLGIVTGIGPGRFDPNGTFTRSQAATIVNRVANLFGVKTSDYKHSFTDLHGHWADNELGWPVYAGIIAGVGDNKFNPNGKLTAEQAITIVYRALQVLSGVTADPITPAPFPDGSNDTSTTINGVFYPGTITSTWNGEKVEFSGETWLVLDRRDGKALLMHDTVITQIPYDYPFSDWESAYKTKHPKLGYGTSAEIEKASAVWETSTVRKWLNGTYLKDNFTEAERARILTTYVVNENNPWTADYAPKFGFLPTVAGSDTQDKVFILSLTEVFSYLGDIKVLSGDVETKDKEHNSWRASNASWWIRTPGAYGQYNISMVFSGGIVSALGIQCWGGVNTGGTNIVFSGEGVRPAIWVSGI
jgi:hypothetical protein